jgi:hypothetical protein
MKPIRPFHAAMCLLGMSALFVPAPAWAEAKPPAPVVIRFDKNPEKAAEPSHPLEGRKLVAVAQGLIELTSGTEYRVTDGKVIFEKKYALGLKGRTRLALRFSDQSETEITLLPFQSSKVSPAIEFDPPPGSYDHPQHVILTSAEVGARIRYTTDGTDPTPKSPDIGYRTVLIERPTTLKARAFTKGKEPGPVTTARFEISGTKPPAPAPTEPSRDASPGAGAYEVYVGAAFYMDEMLDRSQWPYVAQNADGLYHRFLGVDPLGEKGKQVLASHFKGGKAVMEGGMHGPQHIGQDEPWIADLRKMGLKPIATFVNGLNLPPKADPTDLTQNWQERIDRNLKEGILSFTMQAPHRIVAEGGWEDSRYDRTKRWTLLSAGTSADPPTYLFTRREEAYRKANYDVIRWTHANKRKFMFLVSPNEGSDTFLRDSILTVQALEDNDARPDFYGVTLYGKRPLHLVPETVVRKDGKPVGADTLTGVACYLLKHARADGGELDLWVDTPGKPALQGAAAEKPEPVSLATLSADKAGGRSFTLVISNSSHWVDFIPVLRLRSDNAEDTKAARFVLDGKDITDAVTGSGHVFLRKNRLLPGGSQRISVTLPSSLRSSATLELLPYPGSRFVRDRITLKQ